MFFRTVIIIYLLHIVLSFTHTYYAFYMSYFNSTTLFSLTIRHVLWLRI